MRFVGLDVHKQMVEAVILDATGGVLARAQVAATRAALERFAEDHLGADCTVALEATTNTWAVERVLAPWVHAVVVSNPLKTRAIAEAKVKTDRVDALVLAQLLRTEYLPRVWTPDAATQRLRELTSRRASLVAQCTRGKNRLHAVLHQRLIALPAGVRLFTPRGRQWLTTELALDPDGRAAVASELRLLDAAEQELALLTRTLAETGRPDPRLALLLTLPGVQLAVAQTLLATLGDTHRFRSGDHAASYLGLVPSTRQSAAHCYHGPITKQGNGHARWMLVQAAQHLATHPGPLGVFFRRVARRKNRNVAVVATARKLVVIAWHLLEHQEPYRYAVPRTTASKLAQVRVLATGQRRRGGVAMGTRRPASYGNGHGTRTLPALDAVYSAEGLPARPPRAHGETRMLHAAGLTTFVASLDTEHTVPRSHSTPPTPEGT
ncbi:MAG TPA: IS110 family transposase [Gemmatimonadaceae bacterium]|jgi:transposase